MKNYGVVKGTSYPKKIEVTDTAVFIASNIQPYEDEIDSGIERGYKYNYIEYSKDEYIAFLHESLIDTQLALCEIMEAMDDEG